MYISRLCYDISVRLYVRLSVCDGSALAHYVSNSDPNLPRIVVAGRGHLSNNISRYASHFYAGYILGSLDSTSVVNRISLVHVVCYLAKVCRSNQVKQPAATSPPIPTQHGFNEENG